MQKLSDTSAPFPGAATMEFVKNDIIRIKNADLRCDHNGNIGNEFFDDGFVFMLDEKLGKIRFGEIFFPDGSKSFGRL